MFTAAAILTGLAAAFIIGFSKTALPGAALIAIPMIATVVEGRLVPGASLPILLAGDVFAVAWYRRHTRWDLLRPLSLWVGVGFALGVTFFIQVGAATRSLEITIGLIVLLMVVLQVYKMRAGNERSDPDSPAAPYGIAGGFTTFVSNSAGPVMNTYLASLRLSKEELVGTTAVFYFVVNLAKIPFYLALGEWSDGGRFFTWDSLSYGALVVPGVLVGVVLGRRVFGIIPQRAFLFLVLVLSGLGAIKLLF
ncbi:MAG: sulfite exporter TauE/SafE family protein [Acidimicrobiales bacterium]